MPTAAATRRAAKVLNAASFPARSLTRPGAVTKSIRMAPVVNSLARLEANNARTMVAMKVAV